MSSAREGFTSALVGSDLWIVGGHLSGQNPGDSLPAEVFHSNETLTQTSPDMSPLARYMPCAAAVSGKVYVFGGAAPMTGTKLNRMELLVDVPGNVVAKTMSRARESHGSIVFSDLIDVMGGWDGGQVLSTIETYDTTLQNWPPYLGSLLGPQKEFAVAQSPSDNFLFGGDDGTGWLAKTVQFIHSDGASDGPIDMLSADHNMAAAYSTNGLFYLIGGEADESLTIQFDSGASVDPYTLRVNIPQPRHSHALVGIGTKLYAIGGQQGAIPLTSVQEYDTIADSWANQADLPAARYGAGAVAYSNEVFVIGGTVDASISNSVLKFSPFTNTWESLPSMPTARKNASCVLVGNTIYVIGGADANGPTNFVESAVIQPMP
jgi:hypothetical protein